MLLVVTLVLLPMRHPALSQSEALFSDTNAYNPVPSPDGSLVAFVRTGWGRMKPAFDLGRADLVSEIEFASNNLQLAKASHKTVETASFAAGDVNVGSGP
jgi:hypothetical protein